MRSKTPLLSRKRCPQGGVVSFIKSLNKLSLSNHLAGVALALLQISRRRVFSSFIHATLY
jgi:hypothetical protein